MIKDKHSDFPLQHSTVLWKCNKQNFQHKYCLIMVCSKELLPFKQIILSHFCCYFRKKKNLKDISSSTSNTWKHWRLKVIKNSKIINSWNKETVLGEFICVVSPVGTIPVLAVWNSWNSKTDYTLSGLISQRTESRTATVGRKWGKKWRRAHNTVWILSCSGLNLVLHIHEGDIKEPDWRLREMNWGFNHYYNTGYKSQRLAAAKVNCLLKLTSGKNGLNEWKDGKSQLVNKNYLKWINWYSRTKEYNIWNENIS